MKRILTIAGSDSGGGAGIQADLKAITLLGGYGMSVVTALTAQNTTGVQAIHPVPASFVKKQIDAVLSDIGADVIKTGMLANKEIVEVVAKKIGQYGVRTVVVDPVMISKSGAPLLRKDAQKALIQRLIPLATVLTPNLHEASALTNRRVRNLDEMRLAAIDLWAMGAKFVVVKGGHLKEKAVDLLYDGANFIEFEHPKVASRNTHGTGCTFASAIATFLARGESVPGAVSRAKDFITLAIRAGINLGKGTGPTNPTAYALNEMARYDVIQELKASMEVLREKKLGHLVPEVSSNLGYALPFAVKREDVAAFPGRIVRWRESMATFGSPEFGASRHVASIILTAMRFNPSCRSAMNLRYSKENVSRIEEKGFLVGHFDRRLEPKEVKEEEGSTLEWGVNEVIRSLNRIPDFIYDEGDIGKEPMIRVLGRSPAEVVEKVLKVFEEEAVEGGTGSALHPSQP
ncbi:MAG: bifunctional hydroxymethylpyrimidine kinase/phosphomethylpyrimidine kinase [Desulfobacterota bacterium]|nr:bifunctional hydroxymethylpyrimidine kinase/phosphomethylpyrimidine kinase [Thermodesulfobacteriota bacterium]